MYIYYRNFYNIFVLIVINIYCFYWEFIHICIRILDSPFDLERCGPAVDLALEIVNEKFLKHHKIILRKVQERWVKIMQLLLQIEYLLTLFNYHKWMASFFFWIKYDYIYYLSAQNKMLLYIYLFVIRRNVRNTSIYIYIFIILYTLYIWIFFHNFIVVFMQCVFDFHFYIVIYIIYNYT